MTLDELTALYWDRRDAGERVMIIEGPHKEAQPILIRINDGSIASYKYSYWLTQWIDASRHYVDNHKVILSPDAQRPLRMLADFDLDQLEAAQEIINDLG